MTHGGVFYPLSFKIPSVCFVFLFLSQQFLFPDDSVVFQILESGILVVYVFASVMGGCGTHHA